MKNLCRYILLTLCLLPSPAAGREAQVRVYAQVEATTIYPGDDFVYSVVVEGGVRPDRIDLSALKRFNPRRVGGGTVMDTLNDRTTISYSEKYAIAAGQPGTMQLPGATVTVGGRTYTTNAVDVTVSQAGTTDRMSLEFIVSEMKGYVGQPLVMTVRWTVRARLQGFAFNVPVFKSDDFHIEDVSQLAGAWAQEQVAIDGVPVTMMQDRQSAGGAEAVTVSFTKVLIPKRAGRPVLDPITVTANMEMGRVRTNDFFNPYQVKYNRVSVKSNAVELDILPLPETRRPDQFYGLIGPYTIAASAVPTKVGAGDPITLTIRIGGSPFLKPVQWPALEQVPALAANFKIPTERASPVIEGGAKVFTQTIRANSDKVTQIPPIPLAYFDPARGTYVVAQTEPIGLEVTPTKVLSNADVEGTGFTSANREIEAIRQGLSANYYGPEVLANQSFSLATVIMNPVYVAIWSIPLAVLAVSSGIRFTRRTSPESLVRKRRGRAAGLAVKQLRAIPAADPVQRHQLLQGALRNYIGDRFDRIAASLTADDCYRVVLEATGDDAMAATYRDLIAACEAARYAPVDAEIESDRVREATELILAIEKKLKQ